MLKIIFGSSCCCCFTFYVSNSCWKRGDESGERLLLPGACFSKMSSGYWNYINHSLRVSHIHFTRWCQGRLSCYSSISSDLKRINKINFSTNSSKKQLREDISNFIVATCSCRHKVICGRNTPTARTYLQFLILFLQWLHRSLSRVTESRRSNSNNLDNFSKTGKEIFVQKTFNR